MSTLRTVDLPHDALFVLAGLGARLAGSALEATPIAGCNGEAMLVVEGCDHAGAPATWLITATRDQRLMLEAVVDETRLHLLAVAPPDRILALMAALAGRMTVDA